jgi:hypothetical protein
MDNDKGTKAGIRWRRVENIYYSGVVLVGITGILATVRDRIVLLLSKEGLNQSPAFYLSILLLLLVLGLIVVWISANKGEIEMLHKTFRDDVPQVPFKAYCLVAGIAILLGIMGYFSNNIMIFSGMFATYNVLAAWGQWTVNNNVRQMLMKALSVSNLADSLRRDLKAIEKYYLDQPHYPRHIIIIFTSFISFTLSLMSKMPDWKSSETLLISIAYVIMILNFLVSEIVIWVWRKERDGTLEENYK